MFSPIGCFRGDVKTRRKSYMRREDAFLKFPLIAEWRLQQRGSWWYAVEMDSLVSTSLLVYRI
jgi:hypothetical protein